MTRPARHSAGSGKAGLPRDYAAVLADVKRMIGDSRCRALATVNRELVWLYWQIGRIIVRQQEAARWGDAVVEELSADLRVEFPDMKGLRRDNLFRMRQFYLGCRRTDARLVEHGGSNDAKVGTVSRQFQPGGRILSTLSREFSSRELPASLLDLSWPHHRRRTQDRRCHLSDRAAGRTVDPAAAGTSAESPGVKL